MGSAEEAVTPKRKSGTGKSIREDVAREVETLERAEDDVNEESDSALPSFGGVLPDDDEEESALTLTLTLTRRGGGGECPRTRTSGRALSLASAEAQCGVEPRRSGREPVETARLLESTEAAANEARKRRRRSAQAADAGASALGRRCA
jgi:hypothetical protein